MTTSKESLKPISAFATITIVVAVIAVIIGGILLQGGSLKSPLPFIAGIAVLGVVSAWQGTSWTKFQKHLIDGMATVGIAVFVLILVGALIAIWIAAGIIPSMLDYGLNIISPAAFLPTAFVFCAITSIATGTSFGTIGTVGVAVLSIGTALNMPPEVTAGTIVSGAYFGDKMSPASDTTNIAAAMGSIDIFKHIRSMMYTTIPASIVCLIGYWIMSSNVGTNSDAQQIAEIHQTISSQWDIRMLHLLPVVFMVIIAIRKTPTLIMLSASIIVGIIWAMAFQNIGLSQCIGYIIGGYESSISTGPIASLLNRGGIQSTYPIVIIILLAGALGGAFKASGLYQALFLHFFSKARSARSAILSQIAFGYLIIISSGSMALALVLPGQIFRPVYKKLQIDMSVMTRTLEDIGTLTSPVIPWAGAALFAASVLDVSVTSYMPYAWLSFAVPFFSILYAFTGFAIWKAPNTDVLKQDPAQN